MWCEGLRKFLFGPPYFGWRIRVHLSALIATDGEAATKKKMRQVYSIGPSEGHSVPEVRIPPEMKPVVLAQIHHATRCRLVNLCPYRLICGRVLQFGDSSRALCSLSLRFNCGYSICYGLNGVFGNHNEATRLDASSFRTAGATCPVLRQESGRL